MSIELKIKSKHLSEEARIIRFEENKLKKQAQWLRDHQMNDVSVHKDFLNLKQHRRWDVRNENRATFLARAYLEGKSYREVESKRKTENEYTFTAFVIPRVLTMVNKYGNVQVTKEEILEWCKLE